MEKIFSKFAAKYCEVKCISRNNFSMKVCFCSTFDNNIRHDFIYCLIELSFSLLKVENKKKLKPVDSQLKKNHIVNQENAINRFNVWRSVFASLLK